MEEQFLSNTIFKRGAKDSKFGDEGIMLESHPVPSCEKVKEFRGNLIANVAHDLRTPLQSIIGYSETMAMKNGIFSNEDQQKYLNIILTNANKLSYMIEQFFEYSKLEVSEIIPDKHAFPPEEIIYDLTQNYKLITAERNVSLNIHSEENLPAIYGD